jgi:HD-GYP domain-containing protein (c-di-GMP phosphodiesterase class II)
MTKNSNNYQEFYAYGHSLVAFIPIKDGGLAIRVLRKGQTVFENDRSLWGLIKFDRSGLVQELTKAQFALAVADSMNLPSNMSNSERIRSVSEIIHESNEKAKNTSNNTEETNPVPVFLKGLIDGSQELLPTNNSVTQRYRDYAHLRIEVAKKVVFENNLERLLDISKYADYGASNHRERVGELSALIGEHLGLSVADVEMLNRAARLHDIGKIGIPNSILRKSSKLTTEEWITIQSHTTIGADILSKGSAKFFYMASQIALAHHERWDGSGFPRHLSHNEIPLVGRIVAVADIFDALTQERPYRLAWSPRDATKEMKQLSGKNFDPDVLEAFLEIMESGGYDANFKNESNASRKKPKSPIIISEEFFDLVR